MAPPSLADLGSEPVSCDGVKEKRLMENRTLPGWIKISTTVAVAPTTNKRMAKVKVTKQDFIPIIVCVAL